MVRFVPPAPLDAATLGGAFSLHYKSAHSETSQLRCITSMNNSSAYLCVSLPLRCLPMLCYTSRCEAIPLLIKGIPCHSTSEPVEAIPLLITAILRHHISSQDLSPHCRCSSTLFPAKPFRCFPGLILAVQGRARLVHATPLRYSISSQRNRPFPLLRHWPMPENLP